MKIRLDVIAFDAGTQIREAIDAQVVTDYADAMVAGAQFPPVVLFHDGNQHCLADGFHRFMAAQRLEFREIDADVRAGTKEDALWFALGANREHARNGLRLNHADKRKATIIALKTWPSRSATQVGEQIGIHQTYVSRLREQVKTTLDLPEHVVGKDNKVYPSTHKQPDRQPSAKRQAVIERLQNGESAAQIVRALGVHPQTVLLAKRAIGIEVRDNSRDAVLERRKQMRQMAADGHSSRQIAAALGLSDDGCRDILRKEGIDVPADRITRNARHANAGRIVERMVMDAENLTADVNLIDFADLDRERLGEWIDSLIASKKALTAFIQRLIKEKQKHVQAA